LGNFVDSFKKITVFLIIIIILAITTIYILDEFIAPPINLPLFFTQALRIIIIIGFGLTVIFVLRKSKSFMNIRIGNNATTILQFLMGAITVIVISFGVLHTLGVSPATLLTGAGIITITLGLIISTFVGGILAGALVFTTQKFKVGDTILINNIPAKVTDITALVTRIKTDVGEMSIPNSAIASGSIIITAVHKQDARFPSRLPYSIGDRVVTLYKNEEGTVKELTPLYTIILLDSGKELTFLNSSILSGIVAIAKISQTKKAQIQTREKLESKQT
jgi:small-conductance mechanosensitive channel